MSEKLNISEEKQEKSVNKKSKKLGVFIFIMVIVFILGSLAALIKFNVFGVGEKLRAPLGNVPIIKNLLPKQEEENAFANLTKDELVSLNQDLEESNTSYTQIIENLNKKIEELNSEITRLREIETQQLQFKEDKEEFDRMIALNDTSAYASFYENISPENAEQLYKEAVIQNQQDKEFKTYAQTFENMKKDAAASILEELISSDVDLVVKILNNLSSDKRGEILSAMSSENAAICIKKMNP